MKKTSILVSIVATIAFIAASIPARAMHPSVGALVGKYEIALELGERDFIDYLEIRSVLAERDSFRVSGRYHVPGGFTAELAPGSTATVQEGGIRLSLHFIATENGVSSPVQLDALVVDPDRLPFQGKLSIPTDAGTIEGTFTATRMEGR